MDIGLRDGCPCNPGTCDCQDDAGMQLWSREHPAAVCLFATEIPVMQLNVQVFDVFTIKVSNPDGVTVWDVMNEMRRLVRSH